MVLHWHPHPVRDVVFTNDGMLFLTLLCALIIRLSGRYLIIGFKWLTIFPGSTIYVIVDSVVRQHIHRFHFPTSKNNIKKIPSTQHSPVLLQVAFASSERDKFTKQNDPPSDLHSSD